ncbi:MAG: cell wall hydrolase [Pseudomonadota bacterium]|nr:cell wall hydrolase [Pseudomonadota bacterium]
MTRWHTIGKRLPRRVSKASFAALALVICAGVSAHAALRAMVDQDAKAAITATPLPAGYEAQDHFPGAAPLYAIDDNAAPRAGVTGTIALPDIPLPPGADGLAGDAGVYPAKPFSMARASETDRSRALQCLTAAIYYEAAREPDDGQAAVAQVVLNRVRHPAFPHTVCGVVYQGSEHAGCQFSFACDGSTNRAPSLAYWARAARVAALALNGRVFAPVGLATHYHTYAVTPSWNKSLVMTAAIGAHFFHRWKGWWGTPAAFNAVYAGSEPFPGPHPREASPLLLASASVPVPGGVAPAPAPLTTVQPAYAQSGAALTAPATEAQPGDSQILDKWKDSGKPLR